MRPLLSPVPTLAWRFLSSKASDGFLSFIAWVSVVGVSLGVLALVVVTGVINGFEGELVRIITGMNGDVVLYTRGDPVGEPDKVEARIRKLLPLTEAVSPSFVTQLMASGPGGVSGAVLEGIDSEAIGLVTAIPKRLTAGRLPVVDGEFSMGTALAEKLGLEVGSVVRLILPFVTDEGKVSEDGAGQPKIVEGKVVGLVKMGMYDYDSKFVFAALPAVQGFLNQPGKVSSFKIKFAPGQDAAKAAATLTDAFGYPFRAKDWGQLNKNLFYAVKLEKAVIAIILTVIVIVAAFNVVSTLMMMVHDKTREIAILKAMGFRRRQSFLLFCLVGMGIGSVGVVLGIALGLIAGEILQRTRWLELPADIYHIAGVPIVTHWAEVGMISAVALAICFVATLYPAIQVSQRAPLEGLRHE